MMINYWGGELCNICRAWLNHSPGPGLRVAGIQLAMGLLFQPGNEQVA